MPTRTPRAIVLATGTNTWTNQPAALTEFLGLTVHRSKIDLTDVDKIRLTSRVNVAGVSGSVIFAQYSTDESNWSTLTTNQISLTTTGTKETAWEAIPAGARGNVFVRIVGQNGNATADPVLGNTLLEVA